MARTVRTTAVAVILAATAAGCSGGGDPGSGAMSPEPTPSTTTAEPSSSPSPSASADGEKPERPAAMEQHDAEGAAAAAEYFLSLYNYTKTTGETAEWESMSHEACDFCRAVVERTTEIQREGLTLDGGDLSYRVLESYARDAATGIFPLDMEVTQEASTTTAPNGSVESSSEKQTDVMRIEMGLRADEWVVVTVAPKPEE
ncbi:DUF6318 family protein [Isoptericola variabilis]|uniref:DUF6318 domain-containing protein n=1 Tax=Isoptericola variabilis (strain 225) TaxID=743718 RepID=F6FTP0_ISOV2|nr:DUF6318 family protein [Isoptericola variabilis]AEG44167.1 hypothetical protein Isova_1402 [Isoptericola variabilis 225]TWH28518.1 hypothetical protein L600_000400001170 [Isoptericola variabilis J7]